MKRVALLALCATAACRLVATTAAVAVGSVALAGYAVYTVGAVAVTGVGSAAKATGSALSAGSKSAATVVFRDGEFKTEYPASVEAVWGAADAAFHKAGFRNVTGDRDALSGELAAETREGTDIALKLKSLDAQRTEARIRVGVKGDMATSETVHGLIQAELTPGVTQ